MAFPRIKLTRTKTFSGSYKEYDLSSSDDDADLGGILSDGEPPLSPYKGDHYSEDEDYEPPSDESSTEEDTDLSDEDGVFSGGNASFSQGSIIELGDAIHQEIFDRLPISQTNRALLYKWILEEEEKKNESATGIESAEHDL